MARRMAGRMHRRMRRRRRRRILMVGGLLAVGAYKLSKKDVEKVEEHTGQKAEELTDEQLEQAMRELGIDAEELTDEELDQVEAAEDQLDAKEGAAPASTSGGAPAAGAEGDYLAELERLADLNAKGIITDEEFEAKKKQLLGL